MQNRMLKTTLTCAALACAMTIASIHGAKAQNGLCAPRDEIIKQLKVKHGETRQVVGLQRNFRVMETYANPETGTWTIIVSNPNGVACLVAAGQAFEASATDAAPLASEDDPA